MRDRGITYSGTDLSGKVWEQLARVIEDLDAGSEGPEDLALAQQSLEAEGDPNWRGFAAGLLGLVQLRLGQMLAARASFELAIETTCTFRPNFEDVVSVYCQSCYSLGSILFDHEDANQEAILCFLRSLPYLHDVYPDLFIGNVFGFLDVLYSREDRDKESLVFAESALYYHGRDAGTLESLMLAYANVGNLAAAGAVYHELLSCCKDEAVRARARDFARRRLPAGEP